MGSLYEIIVADGGSTDRTMDIARDMGVTILQCKKKGRAVQMNEGAAIASGDLLYFLHADTIPPKNFDQLIIRTYQSGYKAGCFRLQFDDTHWALRFFSWFTRFETTWVRFGDQSLFVEKEIFYNSGGFDESLVVMEDQEIIRRLKKQFSFKLINEYVVASSRKYRENGVYRLQFIYGLIFMFYYAGVCQQTLVHLYKSLIKNLKL